MRPRVALAGHAQRARGRFVLAFPAAGGDARQPELAAGSGQPGGDDPAVRLAGRGDGTWVSVGVVAMLSCPSSA